MAHIIDVRSFDTWLAAAALSTAKKADFWK
jgi:hypothetical protein